MEEALSIIKIESVKIKQWYGGKRRGMYKLHEKGENAWVMGKKKASTLNVEAL